VKRDERIRKLESAAQDSNALIVTLNQSISDLRNSFLLQKLKLRRILRVRISVKSMC